MADQNVGLVSRIAGFAGGSQPMILVGGTLNIFAAVLLSPVMEPSRR
jgi:hypothetical protein